MSLRAVAEVARKEWQSYQASRAPIVYERHVAGMIARNIDKAVIPPRVSQATGEAIGTTGYVHHRVNRIASALNTRRRQEERNRAIKNTVLGAITAFVPPALGVLANIGASRLGIPEVGLDTLAQGVRLGGAQREIVNLRHEQQRNPDGKIGIHKEHERTFIESGLLRLALHLRYVEKTQDQFWVQKHPNISLADILPVDRIETAREQLDTLFTELQASIGERTGKKAERVALGSNMYPILSTELIKRDDMKKVDPLVMQFFNGGDAQSGKKPVLEIMMANVRKSDIASQRQLREMMMEGAITGAQNYLKVEGSKIQERIRWQRRIKWINRGQTLGYVGLALSPLPAGFRDFSQADTIAHAALTQIQHIPQGEVAAIALAFLYRGLYLGSIARIAWAGHKRTKYFAETQKKLQKQLKSMQSRTHNILTHLGTESLFTETDAARHQTRNGSSRRKKDRF